MIVSELKTRTKDSETKKLISKKFLHKKNLPIVDFDVLVVRRVVLKSHQL